jgi:intein/homing endonuclease
MADDQLSSSLSESLLTLISFVNSDKSRLVVSSITPELFDGAVYRDIATRVITYWKKFNQPPGSSHIDDLFDHILGDPNNRLARTYKQLLFGMYEQAKSINVDFVSSRVFSFVKQQTLKLGVLQAAQRYQQGGDDVAEDVERILLDTVKTKVEIEDPGVFLGDKKRALKFLDQDQNEYCPIGIHQLDYRGICPTRKELFLFIGARKAGKCIEENSLVLLPNGKRKSIKKVFEDRDPFVLALNEELGEIIEVPVFDYYDNGLQDCWEVITKQGKKLITTQDHLYKTESGWKKLSDLQIGIDRIAVPTFVPNLGKNIEFDSKQIKLLGYLIADGGLTDDNSITFTKEDVIIQKDFESCVSYMEDFVTWHKSKRFGYLVSLGKGSRGGSNTIQWLRKLGIQGLKSKHKFIPNFIFELSDKLIGYFLQALFSCDGSVYGNSDIEYSSSSSILVEGIHHCLLRLGIVSKLFYFSATLNGKKFPGYAGIYIRGKNNLTKFKNTIGFIGVKSLRLDKLLVKLEKKPSKFTAGCRRYEVRSTKNRFVKYSNFMMFDKIQSISYVGKKQTYDLAIAKYHNFLANDVLVHNSWFVVNVGKKALLQRWKVCHISLEMSEERVIQRYFQSFFGIAKRNESFLSTQLEFDELRRLSGFATEKVSPTLSLSDPKIRAKLSSRIDEWGIRLNNILVKQFPSGALTISKLKSYLDSIEIVHKFVPDILIVDYTALMKLDSRDYVRSLGQILVDLRGIAVERNIAVVAPAQGNRETEHSSKVQSAQIAGDISMVATADAVITYSRTDQEKQLNLARLYVSNARNDEDRFTILITQNYRTGQFVLQSAPMISNYWETMKAKLGSLESEEDNE